MEIGESACDAAADFDDAVDGFGAAVTRPGGAEVGQELVLPGRGAALSGDLGDEAGVESVDDLDRDRASLR